MFFMVGLVETCHWIMVNGPITVVSLLTIGASNIEEGIEFFNLKSSFWFLALIPYVLLFTSFIRSSASFSQYKGKKIILLALLLISTVFVAENALRGRFIRKGVPQVMKVWFSFSEQYQFYKETEVDTQVRLVEAEKQLESPKTCVLIIGESLNRKHMSLYGYQRKTSPKLEARNDLLVYNNVVSPYSNTINCVLSMLSESNLDNHLNMEQSVDLFDIFSSAGYSTYWLSNQSPYGIWENKITSKAKKAEHVQFMNLSSNSSMEATLTASHDEKLLQPLEKILALEQKKEYKFIVIHLMGSHSSYKKRYPREFDKFSGSETKEQTIAEYDNSVLYNDFVVDSILNILSLHGQSAVALYLSDHGENVYDNGHTLGHTYAEYLPKANVEIPFMLWLSPQYHPPISWPSVPHEMQTIPFVSDDVFYSLLHLCRIKSPYLDAHRSVFHKDYNSLRKRILVDGKNYDSP